MGEAEPYGDRVAGEAARIAELERLLVIANDAAMAMAGILAAIVVQAGLIGRDGLADIIAGRAGDPGSADHNPLLHVLARSIRMNFAGGRFELIEGGLGKAG